MSESEESKHCTRCGVKHPDYGFCIVNKCGGMIVRSDLLEQTRAYLEHEKRSYTEDITTSDDSTINIKLHQYIEPIAQMISALFELMNCKELENISDEDKIYAMKFVVDLRSKTSMSDKQELFNISQRNNAEIELDAMLERKYGTKRSDGGA